MGGYKEVPRGVRAKWEVGLYATGPPTRSLSPLGLPSAPELYHNTGLANTCIVRPNSSLALYKELFVFAPLYVHPACFPIFTQPHRSMVSKLSMLLNALTYFTFSHDWAYAPCSNVDTNVGNAIYLANLHNHIWFKHCPSGLTGIYYRSLWIKHWFFLGLTGLHYRSL